MMVLVSHIIFLFFFFYYCRCERGWRGDFKEAKESHLYHFTFIFVFGGKMEGHAHI